MFVSALAFAAVAAVLGRGGEGGEGGEGGGLWGRLALGNHGLWAAFEVRAEAAVLWCGSKECPLQRRQ